MLFLHVSLLQVGVNSIILFKLLQVTFTSYGTLVRLAHFCFRIFLPPLHLPVCFLMTVELLGSQETAVRSPFSALDSCQTKLLTHRPIVSWFLARQAWMFNVVGQNWMKTWKMKTIFRWTGIEWIIVTNTVPVQMLCKIVKIQIYKMCR